MIVRCAVCHLGLNWTGERWTHQGLQSEERIHFPRPSYRWFWGLEEWPHWLRPEEFMTGRPQ